MPGSPLWIIKAMIHLFRRSWPLTMVSRRKKIIWSKQRINNRNHLYSHNVKSLGADRIEEIERIDKSGNFVVQYAVRIIEGKMVLIAHDDFTMTFQNAWNHAFKIL